jgi:hypothetical protein
VSYYSVGRFESQPQVQVHRQRLTEMRSVNCDVTITTGFVLPTSAARKCFHLVKCYKTASCANKVFLTCNLFMSVLCLFLTEHHVIKAYWGSGGIATLIL